MNNLVNVVAKFVKDNSHHILSVGAVIGTGATAYFTAKATWRASIDTDAGELLLEPKGVFLKKWKYFIPAGVAFAGTTVCIVGSNRVSNRKILAAGVAYSLSEKAFETYREKVVEKLGENKEKGIRDEIAAEKIKNNPPPMIVSGQGVLCFESHTGRYFNSDMETLMQAKNKINSQVMRDDRATLADFYYLIGLKPTTQAHDFGWESPRLLELYCTAVMAENDRPCLAFEYNYIKQL